MTISVYYWLTLGNKKSHLFLKNFGKMIFVYCYCGCLNCHYPLHTPSLNVSMKQTGDILNPRKITHPLGPSTKSRVQKYIKIANL